MPLTVSSQSTQYARCAHLAQQEPEKENHIISTTLARRIRRIGILPTTYKEIKEDRLVIAADGGEETRTTVKKVPQRHQEKISKEERTVIAAELRKVAVEKRAVQRWQAAH